MFNSHAIDVLLAPAKAKVNMHINITTDTHLQTHNSMYVPLKYIQFSL